MPRIKSVDPVGHGSDRRLTPGERAHILRLAGQWEKFSQSRTGRHPRVLNPLTRQLKPEYEKTFVRLMDICDQMHLSPPETYYGLLFDALETREHTKIYTRQLGSAYCNRIVEQGRTYRKAQFAGREDAQTLGYRAPSSIISSLAPESLEQEHRMYLRLRGQYRHFPLGRFWLFFIAEFSGTYLYVNEEYRASGLDLLLHLTPTQLGEWKALEQDPRLRQSITTAFITLSSEGTHAVTRQPPRSVADAQT